MAVAAGTTERFCASCGLGALLAVKVEEHLTSLQSSKGERRVKQDIAAEKAKYTVAFATIVLIDVRVLNICCSTKSATLKCWINSGMY